MTTTPPRLHEILAVEGGLQAAARRINEETIKTLGKKDEHFTEHTRRITHFAEEDSKLNTEETKSMVTTVGEKLRYNAGANIKAWDAYLQKEATNQNAKADIEIDGKTLAADVPATVLLGMETKLAELRAVYEAAPTLAPGPDWKPDIDRGKGVFAAAEPEVTFRTRKTIKPIVMAPATEQHPAQVQAVTEDVAIARIETRHWSGMLTSAQKSELLAHIDKLLRAVKRARQRANNTEVQVKHIGKVLFDFIHSGVI